MNEKLIKVYWWFIAPKQWWLRHTLFWCYYLNAYILHKLGWVEFAIPEGELPWIGQMCNQVFLAYTHLGFAIPRLLLRQKVFFYVLTCLLSLCIFAAIQNVLYPYPEATSFYDNYYYRVLHGMEILFQVTAFRLFVEFIYTQQKVYELKSQNLETEMAYLKSQISPHFLFNTLNNIATVSEIAPEKVTPIVIELSNVLRYQLYESEKSSVFLEKEIENLRNYLNLEAIRLNESQCEVRVEGLTKGVQIAPLLFLPFVENAVKHGADPSGKTSIDIFFKIENQTLSFFAQNSKPKIKPKQLAGGIGLKNIQRRLELLYPKKHTLKIEENEGTFTVKMNIFL